MKELEDYTWFPPFLRKMQMEFIGWTVEAFHLYRPLIPHLESMAETHDSKALYDLCSGTGNPVIYLTKHSKIKKATLTDFYPQVIDLPAGIQYNNMSIDAKMAKVPSKSIVTMFNAFHHFDKEEQRQILASMVKAQTPFCIVEILNPSPLDFLKIFFTTTIGQLILAPFVKPFSWIRLLFTYILPINLITVTYDGLVSVLKSGSVKDFRALTKDISSKEFPLAVDSLSTGWGSRLTVISGGYKTRIND